jgi:hypothetical protein
MVGPPRLHEELGANGVEVTAWERVEGGSARKGRFENVASNNA